MRGGREDRGAILKVVYQLLHLEGVSADRDKAAVRVREELSALPTLNTPTMSSDVPCPFGFTRQFKPGEVGLWHSTINVLSDFIDSDYDALLILEDDIVLFPDFIKHSTPYLENLPEGWMFFYQFIHPWQIDNNYNIGYEIGNQYLCRSYQVWSNACYWVSKKGAEQLLFEIASNPIDEAVDWYILKRGMTQTWDVYSLKPNVKQYCNIAGFETTIQNG